MIFEVKDGAFCADGKKTAIYSGAMHYFRILPEYWQDRLAKLKACGFNAVETYMCWDLHEPEKGRFDFSGRLDIRRYIELAGELGLYVILRPGPYICAEWDAGGFPAWLLADENIRLRCNDATYLSHVRDYIARVMEEVGDLQCTEGGPIVAMQVENEYGSYGNDKTYLAALRDILKECGAKVMLFTSDGTCPYMLAGGSTPGVMVTVNFGSNVAGNFAALKEEGMVRPLRRKAPHQRVQERAQRGGSLFGQGGELQLLYVPRRHQFRVHRRGEPCREISAHRHQLRLLRSPERVRRLHPRISRDTGVDVRKTRH